MTPKRPPRIAEWLLKHFGAGADNDTLVGDLAEQYQRKDSTVWYWRQATGGIAVNLLKEIDGHPWITARALVTGWVVWILWSITISPFVSPFFFGEWSVMWSPLLGGGILAHPGREAEFRYLYQFVFDALLPLVVGATCGWLVARFQQAQRVAVVVLFAGSIVLMNVLAPLGMSFFPQSPGAYYFVASDAANIFASVIGILLGGGLLRDKSRTATSGSRLHDARDMVQVGLQPNTSTPLPKLARVWKPVLAIVMVLVVVLFLANTLTFQQNMNPPPYTVTSQITLQQSTAGCPNCWTEGPRHVLMTSYNQVGSEVVLSWSAPDDVFGAVAWAAKLAADHFVRRLYARVFLGDSREDTDHARVYLAAGQSLILGERVSLVNSGCRPLSRQGTVLGQDVVLSYPTIVDEYDSGKTKVTLWMAPELSCFALKGTVEVQQPNSSWQLISEKKALKISR